MALGLSVPSRDVSGSGGADVINPAPCGGSRRGCREAPRRPLRSKKKNPKKEEKGRYGQCERRSA